MTFNYAGLFAKMQQQERVERVQRLIAGECDIQDELIVICEEQVVVDRHDESNNWTCSDPNCPCQGWEIDEQADLANAEYYYNQL